jgi:RimJ/RimL family protein N-acetyltransferase
MTVDTRLRPVESEDVGAVATLLAHPELVGRRGLSDDQPSARSVAAITKAVEPLVDPEFGGAWVVDANGVIGLATAEWWWDAFTPWANVVIGPAHQRHGHGTVAARLLLDHLFGNTPAVLMEYGVPSWDATALSFADSLGGDRVGAKRRVGIRNGHYFDLVVFALARGRWEESHAAGR